MQSDYKEIYRLTSERTGKSEQLYKEIGNFVFAELYSHFRKPKSLIIKLKGVGSWYLRKKRLEIMVKKAPTEEKDLTDLAKYTIDDYLSKKEMFDTFKERLKEYEEYSLLRKETRIKRNEEILEPTTRKD